MHSCVSKVAFYLEQLKEACSPSSDQSTNKQLPQIKGSINTCKRNSQIYGQTQCAQPPCFWMHSTQQSA